MHYYYTTMNLLENIEEKTVSNDAVQENQATIQELQDNYTSAPATVKAISLWQPWASLIPLGLKHYETRSWKTKYRGKLLICSTAKSTKAQHQQYLKICNEVDLPVWDKDNFPRGQAIAICDLVDCIEMTPEFIEQQSQTEILCGDWQVGRFAWKLENIQPLTEPFPVKGKQKLFNVPFDSEYYLKTKDFDSSNPLPKKVLSKVRKPKSSDSWYTPPNIIELVLQVLGEITLDPCADDGRHMPAALHYTAVDDGLAKNWSGKVYMNPPYSHPGVWMKKLQSEIELGRVKEAIALVPAATDTNWLSPVLKTQPVCFWKGRIKFLGKDYQPKNAARQSHVLVYWGENWERFREVFEKYGFVSVPSQFLLDKLSENISSRKTKDKKFLLDKSSDEISSRKTKNEKFLLDKLSENISSRKTKDKKFLLDKSSDEISSRKTKDEKFLLDKSDDEISSRKTKDEKFLLDKSDDEISSRKTKDEKFLLDKSSDEISSRKNAPNLEFLLDKSDDEISSRKTKDEKFLLDKLNGGVSSRKNASDLEFLEDNPLGKISPKKTNNEEFLLDKLDDNISRRKTRRRKGDGSGCIYYRAVTKKGKEYCEAYYQYEVWNKGVSTIKSTKYIPKRLLLQVQRLEAEKAPVLSILKVLGVVV